MQKVYTLNHDASEGKQVKWGSRLCKQTKKKIYLTVHQPLTLRLLQMFSSRRMASSASSDAINCSKFWNCSVCHGCFVADTLISEESFFIDANRTDQDHWLKWLERKLHFSCENNDFCTRWTLFALKWWQSFWLKNLLLFRMHSTRVNIIPLANICHHCGLQLNKVLKGIITTITTSFYTLKTIVTLKFI